MKEENERERAYNHQQQSLVSTSGKKKDPKEDRNVIFYVSVHLLIRGRELEEPVCPLQLECPH